MDNDESFVKHVPLHSIISSLPGNFLLLKPDAPDFTIIDATDAYCKTTKTTKENIISKPLFDVFPEQVSAEKSIDELRFSLNQAIKTRAPDQMALHRYALRNTETGALEDRYWTLQNIPVLDEQGEVSLIIHSALDVTAETRLRKSELEAKESARQKERFYNLLMQAPIAMCLLEGPELVITSANTLILNMWDKTGDVIGKSLHDVLPEFHQKQNTNDIIKAYKSGKAIYGYKEEITIKRGNRKKKIFINYVCQPLVENGKNKTGVLVILYDVTDQVLATKKVEESENKLRSLIDQSTCAISLLRGEDMIFEVANRKAMESVWAGPEIIGKSIFEVLPEWSRPKMAEIAENIFKNGNVQRGYEAPFYNNPDNPEDVKYYTYSINPLWENHAITGTIIMATDVTEHVLVKKRFKEGEERLRVAAEAAELGFWDYNVLTGEHIWDKRCREFFGVAEDQYITDDTLLSKVHPDDREPLKQKVEQAKNPMGNGRCDVEYRVVDNDKERWLRSVSRVFFNEQGKPYRFAGALYDITDTKQEEIRKNDFITMASHELKTPLTSMKAYIQMLVNSAKKAQNDLFINFLSKVEAQMNKMSRMINDFLDLSRMETGRFVLSPERFEMNELIEEVIEEIKPIVAHHAITFEPYPDPLYANADRQKIGEVLLNLLNNAVKYSQNYRPVVVKLLLDGNWIKVAVTDQGIGIPPEDLDKVFQRFYRSERATKHGFSGFGIGLYISAEIIQRHNGNIGVFSKEGEGSEFYFTLPVA